MQEIRVTVDDQGRLQVQSNVPNKALAVGLLELAKAALLQPQEAKAPLLVARGSLPNGR